MSGDAPLDGLEPSPEWAGDAIAAERFGSPEAIRAALLPEQVGEFDAAFDAALIAARQTLHLDQLRHVLRMWRRMALMTEQDPMATGRCSPPPPRSSAPAAPGPAACPGANSKPSSVSDRPQVRTGFLMSYTLDIDPAARAQIQALPPAGAAALAEAMTSSPSSRR